MPPPGPPRRSGGPLPWIVGAVIIVVALVAGAVIVLGGADEADAGEIFLEPAAAVGADPFTTAVTSQAVSVTTTTQATPSTQAGAAVPTPAVSGGQLGLYGGTRDVASCNPTQQAEFLAANPPIAEAFVAALNADPTLRWSGGSKVSVDDIEDYILELTPVTLLADTRVTNHGYRNGRPSPKQAILQAGTAVMVDAFGVPRVKCNCGNPLTAPTAVRAAPVYRGPAWPGFAPTTVVVVTEVTVEIDVYVLRDVETGEPFARPVGTSGDEDTDAPDAPTTTSTVPPTTTSTTRPTTSSTATTATTSPPVTGGDAATFCAKWSSYLAQYGDVDPSVPETVAIFEDLASVAPPELQEPMAVIVEAVRSAAATGDTELNADDYPGATDALFTLLDFLEGTCGIDLMGG